MTVELMRPTEAMEQEVMDYRREYLQESDYIQGGAGLHSYECYADWLAYLKKCEAKESCEAGKVPSTQYLAYDRDKKRVVGLLNFRHELNDYLMERGGHIGYSVRGSERRKGYAAKMLEMALAEAQAMNLQRVLVTCNENNIGSARTIEKNGGILENTIWDEEEKVLVRRYWIDVRGVVRKAAEELKKKNDEQ